MVLVVALVVAAEQPALLTSTAILEATGHHEVEAVTVGQAAGRTTKFIIEAAVECRHVDVVQCGTV